MTGTCLTIIAVTAFASATVVLWRWAPIWLAYQTERFEQEREREKYRLTLEYRMAQLRDNETDGPKGRE